MIDPLQKALQTRKANGDKNIKECKCGRLYVAIFKINLAGQERKATFQECYPCQQSKKGKRNANNKRKS